MSLALRSQPFAVAGLLLMALLNAPAAAAAAEFETGQTAYTQSEVVLRDGRARPVKDEVGKLPAGAPALLIQRWRGPKSHWWKVKSDRQTGWVPESALTAQAPAGQEVAPPPAADAAAPAPGATRAEIERAITRHEGRKSSAIGGYVLGGVLIFAGVVKSVNDTIDEEERKYAQGDYSATPLDYAGIGVGVVLAVPVFLMSVNTHVDANRELNRLRRTRSRISLAPARDGAVVALNLEFGGR